MSDSIGFMSVKTHPAHGYFGGYLIVNPLARPLEFHCTMPLCPSRAQRLLYGMTLDDVVCGQHIAATMYDKAKAKPQWVFTDCPAVLSAAECVPANFLLVDASDTTASEAAALVTPAGQLSTRTIETSRGTLRVSADTTVKAEELEEMLGGLASYFDLGEPFQRIVEALLEAHPIARAA